MKSGDLLKKLFTKASIDTSTEEFKAILALDADVPDEAAGKLEKGLMSLDAAKAHPELKTHFKQQVLTGADAKMDELIAELGLQPDESFVSNKNTYEKIGLLVKLAAEAAKKAAGPGSKTSAAEWEKKEADYNKMIKDLKDSITQKETEFASTRANDLTEFELRTILSGKKLSLPEEMDPKLKLSTAQGAIQAELKKKGWSLKLNEAGELIVVNKEGTPAYSETNEAVEPSKLIDGVLAQNKLLQINSPNPQPLKGPGGEIIIDPKTGGNAAIVAELTQQMEQFK